MKKIGAAIAKLLEQCGLRCGNCGSFKNSVLEKEQLEWGTNAGGILLMDPFYLTVRRRTCADCGHLMTSKVVSSRAA